MSYAAKKSRKRSDYKYQLQYRSRWRDCDFYHHRNNPVYGELCVDLLYETVKDRSDELRIDSVVNDYLIKYCGRRPMNPQTKENGIVVTSYCDFFASVGYPDMIDVCLRVNRLGKTSVDYEVGIFQEHVEEVKAVGVSSPPDSNSFYRADKWQK